MYRSIRAFSFVIPLFLAACATTIGTSFVSFPSVENGQGQLVIFSEIPPDSKLGFSGEVECNGVLCARVIGGLPRNGVFSIHALPPREVLIRAPGKKFIPFAGDVELVSNSLTVRIKSGERAFVRISLIEGREFVGPSGHVGNARQVYRIDLVSEDEALSKLKKGLKEMKFKEALK